MSVFIGKQIERSVLAQMQEQTFAQIVDCHAMQSSSFDPNFDSQIDGNNWHLDPSHPQNHPGAKLVRVT